MWPSLLGEMRTLSEWRRPARTSPHTVQVQGCTYGIDSTQNYKLASPHNRKIFSDMAYRCQSVDSKGLEEDSKWNLQNQVPENINDNMVFSYVSIKHRVLTHILLKWWTAIIQCKTCYLNMRSYIILIFLLEFCYIRY